LGIPLPKCGRGSGSLAFPASSLTLGRRRPGLRGFPEARAVRRPESVIVSPRGLDLPFKALEHERGPALAVPSSLEIRWCPPPSTCLPRVHSREPKPSSARRCHLSGLVPSSWFRSTPTCSSARRSRVCCTPQPIMRFAAFRAGAGRHPRCPKTARETGRMTRRSPRRVSHPPKASPHQQPHRLTTAVALLPSPSCPIPRSRRSDLLFRCPTTQGRPGDPARRSEERGARDAGRRIRLDDAPIRRSGPPRHRARGPTNAPKRAGGARTEPLDRADAEAPGRTRDQTLPGSGAPRNPPPNSGRRPRSPHSTATTEADRCVEGGCAAFAEAKTRGPVGFLREEADFKAFLR
jgi:hypothetical protein